jgi:hypothetical protein
MKSLYWMFCILLLVLTLISALGGSIQYRENFLEEILDLKDVENALQGNTNLFPLNEEIKSEPQPLVEEEKVPINLPKVEPKKPKMNYDVVQGYGGSMFASF